VTLFGGLNYFVVFCSDPYDGPDILRHALFLMRIGGVNSILQSHVDVEILERKTLRLVGEQSG